MALEILRLFPINANDLSCICKHERFIKTYKCMGTMINGYKITVPKYYYKSTKIAVVLRVLYCTKTRRETEIMRCSHFILLYFSLWSEVYFASDEPKLVRFQLGFESLTCIMFHEFFEVYWDETYPVELNVLKMLQTCS